MLSILQVKIKLVYIRPPIWRRVLMDRESTLADLHAVIQHSMGWKDCHPHAFEADGKRYEPVPGPSTEPIWNRGPLDEHEYRVNDLLMWGIRQWMYIYDFEDSWRHKITAEEILKKDPKQSYPVCIEGYGACPPEGSGGPWGYPSVLAVLEGPDCQEKKELQEQLGQDSFDPETFDLNARNQDLVKVKPGSTNNRPKPGSTNEEA